MTPTLDANTANPIMEQMLFMNTVERKLIIPHSIATTMMIPSGNVGINNRHTNLIQNPGKWCSLHHPRASRVVIVFDGEASMRFWGNIVLG